MNCEPVWCEYDPREASRLKAWAEHYMRKGCSETKAWHCARKKTWTWPPRAAK